MPTARPRRTLLDSGTLDSGTLDSGTLDSVTSGSGAGDQATSLVERSVDPRGILASSYRHLG